MSQPDQHRKVHEDSPDRCQSLMSGVGQCNNVKVPGGDFCIIHGGGRVLSSQRKEAARNYQLTKFKARVNEFADSTAAKSLREEIGIARMQLEFIVNKCNDETDLLMQSEKISKLITQIQLLVMSCQKLEEKAGSLLDKTQLFVICESIVTIIADHVTDPEVLDIVASKIMETMTKSIATNPLDDK